MKKPTVFDLIEYMAALIRSEERKKCAELNLQLVHFQVLEYLSQCNKYSDTPASITNYLGITRGTVSQSLILLEKKELQARHATSRNSGTPVTLIRSPTQRMGYALNALRP